VTQQLPASSQTSQSLRHRADGCQRRQTTIFGSDVSRPNAGGKISHERRSITSLIVRGKQVESARYRKTATSAPPPQCKIVLSAGVYHSPQFSCSRASARARARASRNSCRACAGGVGENYQDHPVVTMTLKAKRAAASRMRA
jgi:hypothetical protein